jgi:hypothetical protein
LASISIKFSKALFIDTWYFIFVAKYEHTNNNHHFFCNNVINFYRTFTNKNTKHDLATCKCGS